MHLLIIGGDLHHLGGVEAFCDRSKEALARSGKWRASRIPAGTAFLTLKRLPGLARGLGALLRYRFRRVDCVWLQYVSLPDLIYLLAAKTLGFRVMVTPHLGSNWRSQSNPVLRFISGVILRLANRLALISKTQELEINLPANVPRSLIRNFLPEDLLTAPLPDVLARAPRLQLIHSGRLSEGKGTFLFVDVCERLKKAGVSFDARITGGADQATFDRLHEMIARADLKSHMSVLGRIPEQELLSLFRASDVLVHLSRIDSYPLIVLETISCCMFPVCMELAGARDMIESFDGKVVSQESPVDETAAFLAATSTEEVRRRGEAAADGVRKEYAWSNCVKRLEAALSEVVR